MSRQPAVHCESDAAEPSVFLQENGEDAELRTAIMENQEIMLAKMQEIVRIEAEMDQRHGWGNARPYEFYLADFTPRGEGGAVAVFRGWWLDARVWQVRVFFPQAASSGNVGGWHVARFLLWGRGQSSLRRCPGTHRRGGAGRPSPQALI